MTSVLAPEPGFHPLLPAAPSTKTMPQARQSFPSTRPFRPEVDEDDSRPHSHSESDAKDPDDEGEGEVDDEDGDPDGDGDGNRSASSILEGRARKRRRSRKGLDKKFPCPEKDCGKTYSRAEHLYRHQLNHAPKHVYECGIGDCKRTFVRLDLCKRHRDRHTAKGSALNRKDSLSGQMSPIIAMQPDPLSSEMIRPGSDYAKGPPLNVHSQSPENAMGAAYHVLLPACHNAYSKYGRPHSGYAPNMLSQAPQSSPSVSKQLPSQTDNSMPYTVMSSASTPRLHVQHTTTQSTPMSFVSPAASLAPQPFPLSLPPSDFVPPATTSLARDAHPGFMPTASGDLMENGLSHNQDIMQQFEHFNMQQSISIFGNESVLNGNGRSPYVGVQEDWLAYMLNTGADKPPMDGMPLQGISPGDFTCRLGATASFNNSSQMGLIPAAARVPYIMSVSNLLDRNPPEAEISAEKSAEIFDLIKERFHEPGGRGPVERHRESILEGDRSHSDHMLSQRMMQAYIASYWVHFNDQMPILHKPTFSPNKTPNLLLIAMMIIGAVCLDKAYGYDVTKAGAKLSNFLAWPLRWEMFQDPNCEAPAKLWVFQTLIILELYEKIYSTRPLHERAHIHHATTITLMRRGRALTGKSALDSPPNGDRNGVRQSPSSSSAPADELWHSWVADESTRRTAFAAFVIDSIHATMFGHSTVMVAHEMRLPLPCDDSLWKAASASEIGRIEAKLVGQGYKPVMFLEGLKRTLGAQAVQTNPFGRTILMAGLLSVSWHMNQRDLSVTSLGGGMSLALGGRDKWRATLTRAFDSWKSDFDKSLQQQNPSQPGFGDAPMGSGQVQDPYFGINYGLADGYEAVPHADAVVFDRICLHHLAHMAMHVDVVDCQIYARAKRLLGRSIGAQDLQQVSRRMRDFWAPTSKAREAVFCALKFLQCVLDPQDASKYSHAHGASHDADYEPYSARDDVILHRPWVLYYAALVIWCYGYALEGPVPAATGNGFANGAKGNNAAATPTSAGPQQSPFQPQKLPASNMERNGQMREYLARFATVSSPEDLKPLRGIGRNTAVLMVLRDTFEFARWELLHEAARLLQNCIHLNGGIPVL